MVDKGHCKIAFETDEDRAELADYYNFEVIDDDEAWEDLDEDGDQDMENRSRLVEVCADICTELVRLSLLTQFSPALRWATTVCHWCCHRAGY